MINIYNVNRFNFTTDDTKIIPTTIAINNKEYGNCRIFPSPNGYTKNVQKSVVKYAMYISCDSRRCIGVTTKIVDEWISKGVRSECCCDDNNIMYSNDGDGGLSWDQTGLIALTLN